MTETAGALDLMALAMALFAGCSVLAALERRHALRIVYPVCLAASLLAAAVDLSVLLSGARVTAHLPLGLPTIGLGFRLDPLSALFGLIVNIGVFAASLYGLGLAGAKELSPRVEPFYPAFAAAMNAVLLADDAFGFLFFWELMSVTSWALVVARHEDPAARRAAHIYLLMASIGTVALLFAFGGMAGPAGSYDFDTIRATRLEPMVTALVLAAALVGTGSKAGIMPLHAWLPLAHPAAPSHVSALMSGVMTKVAVYGLIRILFDLLGEPAWWWSLPFILLGAATAVGALLYAVLDGDLKRVLAYSTIENIGIIYVGIGLSLAFLATGRGVAATVAMAAALLHAVNHSWFKSLLFLGAGAVLHATGRRDLDGLGGLIRTMPRTAVYFLVGALAISALPPLNGFVSEWLLFQAILAGPGFSEPILRFLSPVVGAMLALAAAMAAACFVRVYGIAFLGRPRSPAAAHAHDPSPAQRLALALLALLCVVGGLSGAVMVTGIGPVLELTVGDRIPGLFAGPTPLALVVFNASRSTYDATIIAAFVVISASITTLLVHMISNRRTRRAPAWDCGFPDPSPATQYTASSVSQPLRRVYGSVVFSARESVDIPSPGDTRPARFAVVQSDHIWNWLYAAPAHWTGAVALRLNALQFLSIRRYLVLLFAALILLLLVTSIRA